MHLSDLTSGMKVKVVKSFADFDGDRIDVGSVWTFQSYNYFVYDGGYTFEFREGTIRLAEIDDDNDRVLNNFSEFFQLIEEERPVSG